MIQNKSVSYLAPRALVIDFSRVFCISIVSLVFILSFPSFASAPVHVLSAEPSPSPSQTRVALNTKSYLSEYVKAQSTELKAMEHRQKTELKELKVTQRIKLQEWERNEKELRHQYFSEHSTGPERRAYIQDFLKRRDEFRKLQSDERTKRVHDFDAQLKTVKQDQAVRLKEFQRVLLNGEMPSADLWPRPGY